MKQGYMIMGVDAQDSTVNAKHAYALSLSLKLADPHREVCVIVHKFDDMPPEYEDGFDFIVELPFSKSDYDCDDIYSDFPQMYYCTPFDETIAIHHHSLAIDNIELMWDAVKDTDMAFAQATDFAHRRTPDLTHTQGQIRNGITPFRATVMYFTKDIRPAEFFKMADTCFREWREVYRIELPDYRPSTFDLSLMCNIVAEMLGEEYPIIDLFQYQDLGIDILYHPDTMAPLKWTDQFASWFTDTIELKINNHRQTGVVYYDSPDFLTTNMVNTIYDYYTNQAQKTTA
jgi:hypothetical protein